VAIARNLEMIGEAKAIQLQEMISEVARLLNGLIRSLETKN